MAAPPLPPASRRLALPGFALGEVPAHPNQVGVLAARAVERAIVAAVAEADGFGLLPAVRDLG